MSKQGASSPSRTPVVGNPRARHRFELLERVECGVVLKGSEVKSLRAGNASLDEAYARFRGAELFLLGMHVDEYAAKGYAKHEPTRPRKLLLHRRELVSLRKSVERKGLTLVPTRVYFSERGIAKVEVAVARGRRTHDKRQDAKDREARREISRARRR